MEDRIEIKVMGKVLGSADGWSGEMPAYSYLDFKPAKNVTLMAGDLQIDYDTGMFDVIDSNSEEVLDTGSILPFLV